MKLTFWGKKEEDGKGDFDSTKVKEGKKKTPSKEELRLPEPLNQPSNKSSFGIKNYLHQFYQSPTTEDMEGAGGWYLLSQGSATGTRRRGLYFCRALTIIGLCLLLFGAVAIIVGYTWPIKDWEKTVIRINVESDEEMAYLSRDSVIKLFNDPMRPWKVAGLAVFTVGGILLAISLIIPTCANCFGGRFAAGFASQLDTPAEPPIKIFSQPAEPTDKDAKQPSSPLEKKVPVMEEISKVQPDAEEGEGPITGGTLQSVENEAEMGSTK